MVLLTSEPRGDRHLIDVEHNSILDRKGLTNRTAIRGMAVIEANLIHFRGIVCTLIIKLVIEDQQWGFRLHRRSWGPGGSCHKSCATIGAS